jgi:hypothetical protein
MEEYGLGVIGDSASRQKFDVGSSKPGFSVAERGAGSVKAEEVSQALGLSIPFK